MNYLSRKFRLHTLRGQLRYWGAFLTIMTGMLIFLPFISIEIQEIRKKSEEAHEDNLSTQVVFVEQWFQERLRNVQYIANLDAIEQFELPLAKDHFLYALDYYKEFADLVLVDREGYVVLDTVSRAEDFVKIDVRNRPYFQEVKEKREYVTDVIVSKVTGIPIVVFAVPILDESKQFNGLVFGTVNFDVLADNLSQPLLGSNQTFMMNREGLILTNFNPWQITQNSVDNSLIYMDSAMTMNLQEHVGQKPVIYKNFQGEWVCGASAWINHGKWLIVSEAHLLTTFSPFISKIGLMSLCVFVGILLASLLMFKIAHRIESPIGHLLSAVKLIEKGEYHHQIDIAAIQTPIRDFKRLYAAFNKMSMKVNENVQLLEELSNVCQLTKLSNRRYLFEHGETRLKQVLEEGEAFSCLMLDIDHFKVINDTYGHFLGDEVIIHVANILLEELDSTDLVARYGGEEFIILSSRFASLSEAVEQAEVIRKKVEEIPYIHNDQQIVSTVSIGVATYTLEDKAPGGLMELLEQTDKALYKAKEKGRNRIEVVGEEMEI